jgi:hypothetical protein
MRRRLLACLLPIAFTACGDGGFQPRPLEVAIEASRTAAPTGEVVGFAVNAQGGQLLGVTIDYDDGVVEQSLLHSSRTARAIFGHAFTAAGTYQVRATVLDAVAGSKEATIEVRIQ